MHSCLVVAAFGLLICGLLSNLSNEFAGFVYHFAKWMGVGTRRIYLRSVFVSISTLQSCTHGSVIILTLSYLRRP